MTAFPGSEASFTGFTSSHTLAQDVHASQHNLEQSEIVATQHKIGTGASTPASSLVLRGTDVGTSAWSQVVLTSDVTGVLPQANGGTGTTLATGTGKTVYDTSPTISSPTVSGGTFSSPTLTTPTIASFVNANHDHTNSAGGGILGTNAINNGAITVPKLQYGIVYRRQGNSATDWSSGGTTTFDSSAVSAFWQAGKIIVTADNFVITFPVAYSGTPIITATSATASSVNSYPIITAVTASTFAVRVLNAAGGLSTTEQIHWMAVGPA